MRFLGIDPGKTGGLACLDDKRTVLLLESLGEIIDFVCILKELLAKSAEPNDLMIYCEMAQAMPKQGVVGVFTYAYAAGALEGVASALSVPITLVRPNAWTKVMHEGIKCGQSTHKKSKSRAAARRLFPECDLSKASRREFKDTERTHDGIVEALLIAEYGRRIYMGGLNGG